MNNSIITIFDGYIFSCSPKFFNIFNSIKKENNFSTIKDVIKHIKKNRLIVKNRKNKELWVEFNYFSFKCGFRANRHAILPFSFLFQPYSDVEEYFTNLYNNYPDIFKNEYFILTDVDSFKTFKNNMREIDTDGSYFCHVKNNSTCNLYGKLKFPVSGKWFHLTVPSFIDACYLFNDVMSDEEKEYFNEMKCSVDYFIKRCTTKLYILN